MKTTGSTVAQESVGGAGQKFWTTAELLAAGKSRHEIDVARTKGIINRVGRGLYTTAEPSDRTHLEALAHTHPGLVFGRATAAHLYGCAEMQWPANGVLGRDRTKDGGPRLSLEHRESVRTRTVDGLSVTTPVQTAVDLYRKGWQKNRVRVILGKGYRGATGNDELAADLDAMAPRCRRQAEELLDGMILGTASDLEYQLVRRLRAALKDRPVTVEVNRKVRGYRFDIAIREVRLLIEIDSYVYHAADGKLAGERTFTVDRWKGNMTTRWGWCLLRYPDLCTQIVPGMVVDEVVDTVDYHLQYPRGRRLRRLGEELSTDDEVWRWHPSLRWI
jgi:very-short-patch-repair endonuclease